MITRYALLVLLLQAMAVSPAQSQGLPASDAGQRQTIAGWVENGWIGEPAIKVKVKLDTGAKTSSVNAPDHREFEKDGKTYVSFTLTNSDGKSVEIEKPVVRIATIRRAGVEKRKRPVIVLQVCIAGVTRDAEFTIADRSELSYQMLIGRTFLGGDILVDSARTFLTSGLCRKK